MSTMRKPTAADVFFAVGEDTKIREFGQAAERVGYEVKVDHVLCWSPGKEDMWVVRRNKKTGVPYCSCPSWRFPKKIELPDGTLAPGERFCKHLSALAQADVEVPQPN